MIVVVLFWFFDWTTCIWRSQGNAMACLFKRNTIWHYLVLLNLWSWWQIYNKVTNKQWNCDNFYHESFSSAFTPTNMQFIAMPRRFHFRWANFHLLSLFSNFIALIRPRLSISSEGWQRCQREIRMCIAQAHWSLSNVHNFHFVFRMSPLIYQYVIINMYCLAFFGN